MATGREKGTVIQTGYIPRQGYRPAPRNQCLDHYNATPGLVTGILLICGGIIRIATEIILTIYGNVHHMNYSVWGWGGFYVATGIVGVLTRKRLVCTIKAHMTMCFITIFSGLATMIYSAVSAGQTESHTYCDPTGVSGVSVIFPETCTRFKIVLVMHSLAAVTSFGIMITAFVAVVYNFKGFANCKKTRCCSTQSSNTVTHCNAPIGPGQNGQLQTIPPPPPYTEGQNGQYYPDNPPAYSKQVASLHADAVASENLSHVVCL